jgi:hypothetical protein
VSENRTWVDQIHMAAMENRRQVARTGILERPLVKPRSEVGAGFIPSLSVEVVSLLLDTTGHVSLVYRCR